MIDPEIKGDVQEAKARLVAWWEGEDLGRPALLVTARRPGVPTEGSIRPPDTILAQWTDPEYHVARAHARALSTFWGAEALPCYLANTGPGCLCTALGCRATVRDNTTVWWERWVRSWREALPLSYDRDADWWRRGRVLTEELVRNSRGRYLTMTPDVGGIGDIVAAMRGTLELCYDLADDPEGIKAAMEETIRVWEVAVEDVYSWVEWKRDGSMCWMQIWHPRRVYPSQNDLSALIGREQFREFFLPGVAAQARKVEGCIYHLDGPDALDTLDELLSVSEILAIQWTPGAGQLGVGEWTEVYRKVQAAGKNLVLFPEPHEVEELCRSISCKGLLLAFGCESVEEAQAFIASSYRWSHA
ncbi:MAG: hypothetical protein V2A58_13405 [Planctomycetota bacterium]